MRHRARPTHVGTHRPRTHAPTYSSTTLLGEGAGCGYVVTREVRVTERPNAGWSRGDAAYYGRADAWDNAAAKGP